MSLVVCRGVTKRHYYVSSRLKGWGVTSDTIISRIVCRGRVTSDTIMSLVVCRGRVTSDTIMSIVVCRGRVTKRHYYISSCL